MDESDKATLVVGNRHSASGHLSPAVIVSPTDRLH
jgi:hypothetical protein